MYSEADKSIREEISAKGAITFARFMELALYGPGGYYTSGSPISASGDYFTAPSAHPLFGASFAVQLQEMWQALGSPNEFTVVEEGAGNGTLAADISEQSQQLDPAFGSALNYVAVDIAPPKRQHFPVLPLGEAPEQITGCVISNELLDAMPVHRFEMKNGKPLEVFVDIDGDGFVEVLQEPSTPVIAERLGELVSSLPDGYRGEVNAGLEAWAERQVRTLRRGWVLTIDYGFDRPTLYRPERANGSLRTYSQHTLGQNPLLRPGQQDITAHVDFTAVDEAMTKAGFSSADSTTQAQFLAQLGFGAAAEQLHTSALPRHVKRANEAGMRTLLDPEGMGRFVVALHGRDVPDVKLSGFSDGPGDASKFASTPPLLNPERHINLVDPQQGQGSYFEVESFEKLFSDEP